MLRRRDLLRSAAALAPAFLTRTASASSPFWNKEPATAWSAKQIEQLRTNSPWAHKVDIEIGGNDVPSMGGDGGGPGNSGSGRGRGGGRGANGAAQGGAAQATICWSSAKPLVDSGFVLPASFAGKYAISVAGVRPALLIAAIRTLPEGATGSQSPEDHEKAIVQLVLSHTTLAAKGRDPEKATLLVQSPDRASLVFGFDRSTLPIAADDRDVTFQMRLGPLEVSARFEPKQMLYNGAIAL